MSKKRGSRGKSSDGVVLLKVRNDVQLQRTLDLSDVIGVHPHINDMMPAIVKRLEYEENLALMREYKRHRGRGWADYMLYDCMGEDFYDPYEEINIKKGKKGKKSSGKKKYSKHSKYDDSEDDYWENRNTMFSKDEWDDENNYDEPYKSIKFYPDIENELSVIEFHTIKEFNDFCSKKGYITSVTDYNNIVNWNVIHCCLDPISLEYGQNEIITDNSYGALYWTVSDDITKKVEQSKSKSYGR